VTIYDPAATGRPLNIPEAIGKEEGWNLTPPARCRRNCNPGNLDFEPWEADLFDAVMEIVPAGEPARFAAFPDAPSGFAALVHLCGFPKYKGGTLANLVQAWAPPSENNTGAYLANICRFTGLTPETVIDDYLGA
jgi:hypothetical protein